MASPNPQYDFVIVGSGGGSMCAALLLAKHGLNPVILEKADVIGGTTSLSGGVMWIPNNGLLERKGVRDSFEKAMEYLESLIGDRSPASTLARKRAYVAQAPEMLRFLLAAGVKLHGVTGYSDYYDERPGGLADGRAV